MRIESRRPKYEEWKSSVEHRQLALALLVVKELLKQSKETQRHEKYCKAKQSKATQCKAKQSSADRINAEQSKTKFKIPKVSVRHEEIYVFGIVLGS